MIDLDTCACSGKNLAKLVKPAALTLLLKEEMHGYDVVQKLGELPYLAGLSPDPTAVYRALRSMDDLGLVTSNWVVSDSGPAKRCYRITADGVECARRWVETLRDYHAAVGSLLAMAEETFRTAGCCCGGKADGAECAASTD